MKIAILILLHEFTDQQKRLIKHLSKDFDIFVHIDMRSDINMDDVNNVSNNVYAYKKYKVYWGHYNQILATLFLFRAAGERKIYNRFCFISGADLPIRTNKEIQLFFENTTQEFLEFEALPRKLWDYVGGGYDRIDFFHIKSLSRGKSNKIIYLFTEKLHKYNQKILIPFLKFLKVKRNRMGLTYFGGANWMDLTDNCVSQIIKFIDNNPKFLKRFKYTRGADEIFFQTIICNYVENVSLKNKVLRFVDWRTGPEYPRVLRNEDFERVKASNCLFSRKFNMKIDSEIINNMYKSIQ